MGIHSWGVKSHKSTLCVKSSECHVHEIEPAFTKQGTDVAGLKYWITFIKIRLISVQHGKLTKAVHWLTKNEGFSLYLQTTFIIV